MSDLDELRTFAIAARMGSFAKAARQLNVSPAMVGRRIQTLEERYQLRLIERNTRSQSLTETGRLFLERTQAVLDATEALAECSQQQTLSGRIRLTAPTTMGARWLPRVISEFTAAHPDVVFEMNISDRWVDLVGEGFDLAVRVGELQASSLIARRVGRYDFALCASPGFVERHGALSHPEELANARCILNLIIVPRDRWTFHGQQGETVAVTVGGGIEVDNGEAQRMLALNGAGIAYLPLALVEDDLKAGHLLRLLPEWDLMSLPVHTVYPSRTLVPRRVEAFVAALAASAARSA
ncbi:LysR family transcriptional regulator [Devosia sp. XK-2]|uniref:LysR family transcriptional regulator n=1 Tax=Devosia sp. XK-2 TaxID=3126689 RepID=UPI0030D12D7C